jgi:hypothetical protein
MASTSHSLIRQKITERDGFLIALAVSIVVAIFAFVAQFLAASGAISLSTAQQLTLWLVAVALIVLLWIVYMAVGTQARLAREALAAAMEAAKREVAAVRAAAREQVAQPKQAAGERRERDDTVTSDAWVPPDKFRRLDSSKQPVITADVFPDGCLLVSINPQDYDEQTDTHGEDDETDARADVVDIRPRRRVYQCVVVDLNPALKDRPHDAVVNILADQEPSLETEVPHPFVDFDGLTITPWVTDRSPIRMEYELRATSIKLAAGQEKVAS